MIKPSAILEINLKNLVYNYKFFTKLTKNITVAATIKANAYGIGDLEAFKILSKNGCKHFFVATIYEALKIRKISNQTNIYVLNGLENNNINNYKKNNIIPIVNSKEEVNITVKNDIKFGVHIDTGLNRLGLNQNDISNELIKNNNFFIILSHLSSADEKLNKFNKEQNKRFNNLKKTFGLDKIYSLANSMGAGLGNDYHHNLIRPGISLYGGHYNLSFKSKIKPVVKLKAKILQIKDISKNEFIGYNQTYKTNKIITVAILGIGYADGLPRKLSNKGKVYLGKSVFKILGRISMDTITIDITKNRSRFKIGNYVDVINYTHGVDEFAKQCDTISNEILTNISSRVKRIYKYNA